MIVFGVIEIFQQIQAFMQPAKTQKKREKKQKLLYVLQNDIELVFFDVTFGEYSSLSLPTQILMK